MPRGQEVQAAAFAAQVTECGRVGGTGCRWTRGPPQLLLPSSCSLSWKSPFLHVPWIQCLCVCVAERSFSLSLCGVDCGWIRGRYVRESNQVLRQVVALFPLRFRSTPLSFSRSLSHACAPQYHSRYHPPLCQPPPLSLTVLSGGGCPRVSREYVAPIQIHNHLVQFPEIGGHAPGVSSVFVCECSQHCLDPIKAVLARRST